MANLKISRGISVDDIGFCMPLGLLKKHSEKNESSVLDNIKSHDIQFSKLNPQNLVIHLNKSDFIINMLKNDMVNKIPRPHLNNFKPQIIEFR